MARPHIVIIDAGFGGLAAAHALAGADTDETGPRDGQGRGRMT
ncbi:MAG: hypothetical protein ACT4O6_06005 [Reyranella sp.]